MDECPEAGVEVQGTRFSIPKELGHNGELGAASRGALGAPSHDDVDEVAEEGAMRPGPDDTAHAHPTGGGVHESIWRT